MKRKAKTGIELSVRFFFWDLADTYKITIITKKVQGGGSHRNKTCGDVLVLEEEGFG